MEKRIAYYRNPTQGEIGFGYGCLHYIDLPISQCQKSNGRLKKWVKKDNQRYYLA